MTFVWVIASVSEAINEQRIFMIPALYTFDCHEASASRNDRWAFVKNPQKKRAQSYGEATAQRRFGECNL